VKKQKDLIQAVIEQYHCCEKTVKKTINEAANRGWIHKEKSGRNLIIQAL
jgi:predicted transcriptional regulator